jgi:DNA-binding NarL/FixJ family response regulator
MSAATPLSGRPYRIAIIDDHALVLDGLVKTLSDIASKPDVVGASSPTEILDRISSKETFDLIICDLIMDGMNGLAFLSALQTRRIMTPVLLMSGMALDPPLQQMRSLGAKGFIHKSADLDTFELIVDRVIAGRTAFPDEDLAAHANAGDTVDHDELAAINALTDRQKEVLRAIANGETNGEISARLSISPNTVKTHIKHIYMAMGVSRRTACVQKARLYGVI